MITPIRGRKLNNCYINTVFFQQIRNDNPDKGTETTLSKNLRKSNSWLEMITPIRGRKPIIARLSLTSEYLIRNDNPDKGTET